MLIKNVHDIALEKYMILPLYLRQCLLLMVCHSDISELCTIKEQRCSERTIQVL